MAVHLLMILMMTTAMANFACGELVFLQMPLTINPVVQDAIVLRDNITKRFYSFDPTFYSRLSPADIVMELHDPLSFVMDKTIVAAFVLGIAAKAAGLELQQLHYDPGNKWTVNISLSDIESVLTASETNLLPLSDGITLVALQGIGLRVLEKRFNVSLNEASESLYSSNATSFQSILQDWIRVVNFITKTNVDRLAGKHGVSVAKLAEALELTTGQLHNMTLGQLEGLLAAKFEFVQGSFKVILPTVVTTVMSTTVQTSPYTTPVQTTNEVSTINTLTQSTAGIKPTTTSRPILATSRITTTTGNQLSHPTVDPNAISATSSDDSSLWIPTTTEVDRPTEGRSAGEKDKMNLALFVGVPAALLLLVVACSAFYCLKRKRTDSGDSKTKPSNDNIRMNNFWIEKTDGEPPPVQDEARQDEHAQFVRRLSAIGVDSRFKGLKYVSTSSTFAPEPPSKIINPRPHITNHCRQEIFV